MKLYQSIGILIIILYVLVIAAVVAAVIYLFTLVVKALKKYINSAEVREEKKVIRRSLGEELKARRVQCKMTQEFVADALGVSRQAVSKWENGTVDPSTSNLLALAKLYGLSPEALLQNVDTRCPKIPYERWQELSAFLKNAELAPYQSPDPNLLDATDSKLELTWSADGQQITETFDGRSADGLLELLQDITKGV